MGQNTEFREECIRRVNGECRMQRRRYKINKKMNIDQDKVKQKRKNVEECEDKRSKIENGETHITEHKIYKDEPHKVQSQVL